MKRSLFSVALVAMAVALTVTLAQNAASSGQGVAVVRLQSSTPGSAQTGNTNVTGTARAGQFLGGGLGITSLSASALTGTIADARLVVGGDLQGGLSSVSVIRLRGTAIGPAVPVSGEVLRFNGTNWSPSTNGSGLLNVDAALLDGLDSTSFLQSIPVPLNLSGASGTHIIRGINNDASGVSYGGRFESASTSGRGIYGLATSATGASYGVFGDSNSPSGYGIVGTLSSSGAVGAGVYGTVDAANGMGVWAQNTAGSGNAYGLYATSSSVSGVGGLFSALSTTGAPTGLRVISNGISGIGLLVSTPHTSGATTTARLENSSPAGRALDLIMSPVSGSPIGLNVAVNTRDGYGVHAVLNPTTIGTGSAVFAKAFGGNFAIRAEGETGGGLYVSSFGTTSRGAYIEAVGSSATGLGVVSNGADSVAGRFNAGGDASRAVFGDSSGTNGYGGYFTGRTGAFAQGTADGLFAMTTSSGFSGVTGMGPQYGVSGESNGTFGVGVVGRATSSSGSTYGVRGETDSPNGRAIYGNAGVQTGSNFYGVYGYAGGSGFGVYALGDMGASGTKPFRIDHPEDPTGRYLMHFAAEAPKPYNFYKGRVTTDHKGTAWVALPAYFHTINANWDYQLTVVDEGDDFVMAKVSREIANGRFQVRTSKPNVVVCWRVEAERNDPYVQRHPTQDIVEKTGSAKGRYQHPELYGAPPELSENHSLAKR